MTTMAIEIVWNGKGVDIHCSHHVWKGVFSLAQGAKEPAEQFNQRVKAEIQAWAAASRRAGFAVNLGGMP